MRSEHISVFRDTIFFVTLCICLFNCLIMCFIPANIFSKGFFPQTNDSSTDICIDAQSFSTTLLSWPSTFLLCGSEKLSAMDLNWTSLSRRGDQGHLWLSLEVPCMSASQVDLSSNEDSAIMWVLTGGGALLRHWYSPMSRPDMVSLEVKMRPRDGGLKQPRQWDHTEMFCCPVFM